MQPLEIIQYIEALIKVVEITSKIDPQEPVCREAIEKIRQLMKN